MSTASGEDRETVGGEGLLNPDVWVIVPMLNEASAVCDVIVELRRVFGNIVCVDDGSSDASGPLARASGATVVTHPSNLGMGAALQTGFRFALQDPKLRYVVTFDADGQHSVEDARAMVEFARQRDYDVVLGSRFLGSAVDMPILRRLLLRLAVRITVASTGLRLTDSHNGLRVISREALTTIDLRLPGMAHASELLEKVATHRLRYAEHSTSIAYTEYSTSKGQSGINALNIAHDLVVARLRNI